MSTVAVLALVAGLAFRPDRAIRTATATIAHDLCVRMGASTEPRQGMDSFARLAVAATQSIH